MSGSLLDVILEYTSKFSLIEIILFNTNVYFNLNSLFA